MHPIDSPGSAFRNFDGMTWPCPGDRLNQLNRTLRYGEPTKEDLLMAASVLSAYHQLVYDTQAKRQRVISELRKGPNTSKSPPQA